LFVEHGQSPSELPIVAFYRSMFERRSKGDLQKIANVKRFFERFRGDAAWRQAIRSNPEGAQLLFDEKGIDLDVPSVARVWLETTDGPHAGSDAGLATAARDTPLGLWRDWCADLAMYRDMCRNAGGTPEEHPQFDRWRQRQLQRLSRELEPQNARAINSPIVSYELSSGCSVGCWFCGVSAERFGGYTPYDDQNAELWRGMLGAMVERFGSAAATGFCYWATDPSDNPDYCRFIEDHRRITGLLPPTTTAVPLRSLSLTREILSLNERHRHGNNRFSVLTVRALNAIHETFSPDELLTVDLVLHMSGSLTQKAKVGRGLRNQDRIDRLQPMDAASADTEQGSIACVTGFLVNLPQKLVRLVSPCQADETNPDGYRMYGEKTFYDTATFSKAIDGLISEHMSGNLAPEAAIGFASSLSLSMEDGALMVQSRAGLERVMPFRFLPRLVDLVHERRHGRRALIDEIVRDFPEDMISLEVVLQDLFDAGLLEELPLVAAGPTSIPN
jgi:radical SAM family RiPP maturation amino acid epimerase